MTTNTKSRQWSSQFTFLAAAIGSAVGISNIWKFTYVAGENGGGAFVIIYLAALALIAVPALIAELLIGRRGGKSVVGTMEVLASKDRISKKWRFYGVLAAVGIFLALSFYCVVAGWTLDYFVMAISGEFNDLSTEGAEELLNAMYLNPLRIMFYQALFLGFTSLVVSAGIKGGLERVLSTLTPGLFVILLLLLGYSMVEGDFAKGAAFMFEPDFTKLDANIVLMAVGQAFFSLGVGLGVMMTIGAYADKSFSLPKAALIIAAADGGVALLAGLAIFPIVFVSNLSPAEGPGLIFKTLPIAFGKMPGGIIFGSLFFLLMAFAALTSSITLMEAVVAWLEEATKINRKWLAALTGVALWIVGLGTVFSFNIWADVRPLGMISMFEDKTVFGLLDYLVSNIMMPLGGLAVTIIAGWALCREVVFRESNFQYEIIFNIWYRLTRYVVPLAVAAVFLVNLG